MGADAGNYEQHNIGQGDGQRYFQDPARTTLAMGVDVHSLKCKAPRTDLQERAGKNGKIVSTSATI